MHNGQKQDLLRQVGDRILRLREKEGWSRLFLADKLGVTINCLGRWERGERQPPLPVLIRLRTLFDVPMQELVLPGSMTAVEGVAQGDAV